MQRSRRANPRGFGNLCRPIAARKAPRLVGFGGERRATLPITDSGGGVPRFGGVCLKNTSAQLPTVSKSASNGTSAAFECLDELPSARVACFHLAASTFTRFECRAAEGRGGGRQDKLQTCSKSDASLQTQGREREEASLADAPSFSRAVPRRDTQLAM